VQILFFISSCYLEDYFTEQIEEIEKAKNTT
jgi:hypothetical protein